MKYLYRTSPRRYAAREKKKLKNSDFARFRAGSLQLRGPLFRRSKPPNSCGGVAVWVDTL